VMDKVTGKTIKDEEQCGFILDGDMIVKMDEKNDSALKECIVTDGKREMGLKEYRALLKFIKNI